MSEKADAPLVDRLRAASIGVEEWRVADPDTGSYCIAFTRRDVPDPQREAEDWLGDHRARFGERGMFHHYEVVKCMAQSDADLLMIEAADELERVYALMGKSADSMIDAATRQDGAARLVKSQEAEIQRLRAALNEIAFSNRTKTGLKELARRALGI